jgi:hypothetical protein
MGPQAGGLFRVAVDRGKQISGCGVDLIDIAQKQRATSASA